jgi:hypothetical protein
MLTNLALAKAHPRLAPCNRSNATAISSRGSRERGCG